jgi:hypothetical protein
MRRLPVNALKRAMRVSLDHRKSLKNRKLAKRLGTQSAKRLPKPERDEPLP